MVSASILAGVVPTVLYSLVIWWFDRYKKEPLWLLAIVFFWGAVPAIVLSFIAEVIFGLPAAVLAGFETQVPDYRVVIDVLGASAIAPIVEESLKGVALLLLYGVFRYEFEDVLDGIIYGALVGFGFGMTENIFYFVNSFVAGGWQQWSLVVVVRALLFGMNHAFFSSLVGMGLGYARQTRVLWRRWFFPIWGFGAAIFFHAVHNLFIVLSTSFCCGSLLLILIADWGGIFLVLIVAFLAWHRERQWIQHELREEIGSTLSVEEYALAMSYWRRMIENIYTLRHEGWAWQRKLNRFLRLVTELAFKKHQWRELGEDDRIQQRIVQLRAEIAELRAAMGKPPLPQPQKFSLRHHDAYEAEFCPACGAVMAPGSQFCTNCGQARVRAAPRYCVSCGAQLQPGKKVCQRCGRAV